MPFASLANILRSNLFIQFFRYCIVGGISFVVDYSIYYVCTELLGIHYLIANPLGFIAGLVVNYILSLRWVFQNRSMQNRKHEFIIFAIIGLIGLGLTQGILSLSIELLHINKQISKLIAVAVVLFFNFAARKIILFSAREKLS